MAAVRRHLPPDAITAMAKEGGHDRERIVFMHPTDPPARDAMCQVAEGAFRRAGFIIDIETTDRGHRHPAPVFWNVEKT